MVTATFRVELPPDAWITDVSRSFPEARFRLLTGIGTDEGSVELGEVVASDATAVSDAVADCDDVHEYETLYAGGDRVLAQYRTEEHSLYAFLRDASIPPEFPVVVENGWFEVEVTAPRERIAGVRDVLEGSALSYDVLSIVERPDADGLLTDRQRTLLEAAFDAGYYEVPRERTLTELATEAGVDPSTASGVLRRAEERVVAWFLAGSGEEDFDRR